MKLKIDKIVIILICFSLIVGLYTVYQRTVIEKQYKTAEIVLDYNEMKKFADSSEEDLSYWLRKFKDFGAQSVAIQEETINLLIEAGYSLQAEIVSELVKEYKWQDNYNQKIVTAIMNNEINPADVIVTTEDEAIYSYLVSGLEERYADDFYETYTLDNVYYIVLNGIVDDLYYGETDRVINLAGKGVYEGKKVVDSRLLNIGIGYDDGKISLVKEAGLDVILRPINFPTYNEKLADAYQAINERYGLEPRIYIVHGKEFFLGYPDNEEYLLNYIKEKNIAIALIESSTQREHLGQEGLNKIIKDSNYQALRSFSMWDYIRERNKYYNYEGAEEIENTMFRAITERNIRVIYFKPFFEEKESRKFLIDADEYERTFKSLENRLSEHNISFGKAEAMEGFSIGSKRMAVMAFGITLAAVMLFIKMFNIKHKYIHYLYLFALPAAAVPLVLRNLAEKGFAFGSAVVFSGLAIYFFMTQIKKIYESENKYSNTQIVVFSSIILIVSVAISLAGAVFVDSMLADVKYMLEMDIFRGVKFAQILPFGIFMIMFIIYFMDKDGSAKSVINTTVRFLNKEIKIYYGIIAGVIGVAAYIYISRTGHETNIQPSNIEMISRNFMEYVLIARPRTKEFLIAFPAIFAAVFAASKKSELFTGIFMLAGAMGTSSVINTFSHIRTPIYLSFSRTVIALMFGIIIGCVLVLICDLCYRLFVKVQERLK